MFVSVAPVSNKTLTTEYTFINPDKNTVKITEEKTIKGHDKKSFARYRIHPPP